MRLLTNPLLLNSAPAFDAAFRLFEDSLNALPRAGFPAYDIVAQEKGVALVMAIAGFGEEDIAIEIEDGVLTVSGRKETKDEGVRFLHRGIAQRAFKRNFALGESVSVDGAALKDGLLTIAMSVKEPERKVQKIEIAKAA